MPPSPNRNLPPAILLRESYCEGDRVKTRTLANLSKLPTQAIEAVRATLKGETLLLIEQRFEIVASPHNGAAQAVLTTMRGLGFAELISARG